MEPGLCTLCTHGCICYRCVLRIQLDPKRKRCWQNPEEPTRSLPVLPLPLGESILPYLPHVSSVHDASDREALTPVPQLLLILAFGELSNTYQNPRLPKEKWKPDDFSTFCQVSVGYMQPGIAMNAAQHKTVKHTLHIMRLGGGMYVVFVVVVVTPSHPFRLTTW